MGCRPGQLRCGWAVQWMHLLLYGPIWCFVPSSAFQHRSRPLPDGYKQYWLVLASGRRQQMHHNAGPTEETETFRTCSGATTTTPCCMGTFSGVQFQQGCSLQTRHTGRPPSNMTINQTSSPTKAPKSKGGTNTTTHICMAIAGHNTPSQQLPLSSRPVHPHLYLAHMCATRSPGSVGRLA